MLKKVKIAIAHLICIFVPKTYVDVINDDLSDSEFDERLSEKVGIRL